jgi:hypothetical protein
VEQSQIGMADLMDNTKDGRTMVGELLMSLIVAALVITAIGAAALVKVDQIVPVEGTLRTLRSTQDLKVDQPGVVTEVLVKDARFALHSGDRKAAIAIAKEALKRSPNNLSAKSILETAEKVEKTVVPLSDITTTVSKKTVTFKMGQVE